MNTEPLLWIIFASLILIMFVFDTGLLGKTAKTISPRSAIARTGIWVLLALLFAATVFYFSGREKALLFLTGYLIEESLSIDNIFVFFIIFGLFNVKQEYQHKILLWGIFGAIMMRGVMIVAGASFIRNFHWSIYILSAFLIFSGIKMFFGRQKEVAPGKNWLINLIERILPVMNDYEGGDFFVRNNGKWFVTKLLLVLVYIELTDIVFALDSVPAVLAITQDTFIVFTSNIFAIGGLRSLYFAISGMAEKFCYLQQGLSALLLYIGSKMFLHDILPIPTQISLIIIASILILTIVFSLYGSRIKQQKERNKQGDIPGL